MNLNKIIVLFSLAIAASCTSKRQILNEEITLNFEWSEKPLQIKAFKNPTDQLLEDLVPSALKIEDKNFSDDYIADLITDFTLKWEGTPHKIGGMSRNGIDCSGFTVVLFQELFDHQFVGRRSSDIYQEVIPISRNELRPGDLVFFKIYGKRIDHVGVYIGNGIFSHASVQKGVIFSNLTEPYYNKRFFMGGRIKEDIRKDKNSSQ